MSRLVKTSFLCASALSFALALAPRPARASACCGGGHGLGQRLGPLERASIGASLRFDSRLGSHRADARFAPIPAGDLDTESRVELSWLVKPVSRLQLGLTIPALLNARRLGGFGGVGGGLGDIVFSGRYDLVPLGDPGAVPPIALTAAITLPTGRAAADARDPLAADATGLGAAELRPGFVVEKIFADALSTTFAASVGLRTSFSTAGGDRVQLGPRYRLIAAAGPVFPSGLSLAAGLVHEGEPAPEVGGVVAQDASRRRTAALAFGAYDIHPRWTALASFELDLPISGLSKNEPARTGIAVGLRHVWETHD